MKETENPILLKSFSHLMAHVSVKLCQAVKDGLYDGKSFYRLGTPSGEGVHSSGGRLDSPVGMVDTNVVLMKISTNRRWVCFYNKCEVIVLGGQGDKHVVVFLRINMFKLLRHSYIPPMEFFFPAFYRIKL